jgi:hypothetical protein
VRQARAGPKLIALHEWLIAAVKKLSKKSDLAGAIHYGLARWKALTRYRDDGRVEIDNNAAERALRAVALGRKNYLFAGPINRIVELLPWHVAPLISAVRLAA